jgi:hypothetical protein
MKSGSEFDFLKRFVHLEVPADLRSEIVGLRVELQVKHGTEWASHEKVQYCRYYGSCTGIVCLKARYYKLHEYLANKIIEVARQAVIA